jgi:uncharacterized membrane protein
MRQASRLVLAAVGVVLVLTGVAMAVTSDAELWWAPVVVGGSIAVVGVALIAAARSLSALTWTRAPFAFSPF